MSATSKQNHTTTTVSQKCDVIKEQLAAKAATAKKVLATATSNVEKLTTAIQRLNVQQTDALQASDKLRQKYIKEINEHFSKIDNHVNQFVQQNYLNLENKKKEAQKRVRSATRRLRTLEKLPDTNSPKLAVQGSRLLRKMKDLDDVAVVSVDGARIGLTELEAIDVRALVDLQLANTVIEDLIEAPASTECSSETVHEAALTETSALTPPEDMTAESASCKSDLPSTSPQGTDVKRREDILQTTSPAKQDSAACITNAAEQSTSASTTEASTREDIHGQFSSHETYKQHAHQAK